MDQTLGIVRSIVFSSLQPKTFKLKFKKAKTGKILCETSSLTWLEVSSLRLILHHSSSSRLTLLLGGTQSDRYCYTGLAGTGFGMTTSYKTV